MTRIFTNAWPLSTVAWIVGAFALGAVPAGVEAGWAAAVAVAALGPAVVGIARLLTPRLEIACDDEGATVRRSSRFGASKETRFPWADVSATTYEERAVSAGEHQSTIRTFTVFAGADRVLEVRSGMRDFDALIAAVNERAPLPYYWVPRQRATRWRVIEAAGEYAKVARV